MSHMQLLVRWIEMRINTLTQPKEPFLLKSFNSATLLETGTVCLCDMTLPKEPFLTQPKEPFLTQPKEPFLLKSFNSCTLLETGTVRLCDMTLQRTLSNST